MLILVTKFFSDPKKLAQSFFESENETKNDFINLPDASDSNPRILSQSPSPRILRYIYEQIEKYENYDFKKKDKIKEKEKDN